MIKERMMKFLCMREISEAAKIVNNQNQFHFNGKLYNATKFLDDLFALTEEFLEPYVIESDSKE